MNILGISVLVLNFRIIIHSIGFQTFTDIAFLMIHIFDKSKDK